MKLLKSLILAVAVLATGAVKAHAATETYDVQFSSCTNYKVNVASAVTNNGSTPLFSATLIGAATTFTTLMEDRTNLFVQNISTFAHVFCAIGLSSTSANGDLSLTQPAELSTTSGIYMDHRAGNTTSNPGLTNSLPNLAPRNDSGRVLIPYCVNDGATGTAPVLITQCKKK